MKIKYILPLVITLLTSIYSYAQNRFPIDTIKYKVQYKYTFPKDTNWISNKSEQYLTLQIGNHLSKFRSSKRLIMDSILYSNRTKSMQQRMQLLQPYVGKNISSHFCNYIIFNRYPKKYKLLFIGTLSPGQKMSFEEEIKFNWEIKSSQDTIILGYPCQKATTTYGGRKYIAYFSVELPFNDGPYKFHGLPGLILKIHDNQLLHDFEAININEVKYTAPILYSEEAYIPGSPEKYIIGKKTRRDELLKDFIYNQGSSFSDETKSKAMLNLKSWNNYIEKY